MLFADDLVPCDMQTKSGTRARYLNRSVCLKGMNVASVEQKQNIPHQEENIKLTEGSMTTVKGSTYLGCMFAAEGGPRTDVNNRVQAAWAKWRKVSGVMCDTTMPISRSKTKSTKRIVKG